ncbi:sensor histidine kinase [Aeromicrobium sp. CTD01-1L150]|uniref:sensor histidine kinase n=1 Tax=Aeromicrobium sp. CTD01-1L150 TaxID=3341830 RepID=UPI0035C21A45
MNTDSAAEAGWFVPTRLLTELWSPATWRHVQSVTTSALLALGGLVVLVPLLAVSILLVPTVVGALVAVTGALMFSRTLASVHRARVAAFGEYELGTAGRATPSRWLRWLRGEITRRRTWRELGYHLVAALLAPVSLVVVVAGWAWGPVLLAAVLYAEPVIGVSARVGLACTLGGGVLLLAAPWAVRVVAFLDTELAVRLLGVPTDEVLSEQLAEVTQSRAGVVDAADAERRRIERDLHDGVQQRLTSLAVHLGIAKTQLDDDDTPARRAIEHSHTEVKAALADLRDFLRGLHPAVLDDRGLDAALSGVVARSPIPVRLEVDLPERLGREKEAVAYFLVSEALTNVLNHADADRAEVTVRAAGSSVTVAVTDDGHGGADPTLGSGLAGLRQRLASVGGTLTVSSPTGGPTSVTGEIPCAS